MCVRIRSSRNRGNDRVVMAHTRESQSIGTEDLLLTPIAVAQVVLSYHF